MAVVEPQKDQVGRGLHALLAREAAAFANFPARLAAGGKQELRLDFLLCGRFVNQGLGGEQGAENRSMQPSPNPSGDA